MTSTLPCRATYSLAKIDIMARLTPEEIKHRYPKGCVVRVREECLGDFINALAVKLNDRIGEVVTHTFPSGQPLARFPAHGRRSEVRMPFDNPEKYLEIVTDEAAIKTWREVVATTEARRAAKVIRKRLL
jgi:hypothetical protein